MIIGIVDDRWGLGAISKLAGQIAAGGILVWCGAYLPWMPLPGGETLLLEPDLSYTLTILLVVITINAVNFIDGLDGLAAGVVGISALAYLVYSYTLTNSVGIPSQSVPAVASAVLAGICIGFLPHNFNPARIFMGDTGAMLLGLLLAYGPISSTASLDQNILVNYSHLHPVNRFADHPAAAAAGRDLDHPVHGPAARGDPPDPGGQVAVRRRPASTCTTGCCNMGHSHRQSVLLMYLWAALFSGTRGRPVGRADRPDLAGAGHRRRDRRAAAGDDADGSARGAVATVAETWGAASTHGPFRRTYERCQLRGAQLRMTPYRTRRFLTGCPRSGAAARRQARGQRLAAGRLAAERVASANGLPGNGVRAERGAGRRGAAAQPPGTKTGDLRLSAVACGNATGASVPDLPIWGQSLSDVPELGEGAPRGPALWSCKVSNQVK